MNEKKLVVYRPSKQGLGALREMILGQAMELFKIRYETLKSNAKNSSHMHLINGIIAGCDVDCATSMIGVICSTSDEIPETELTEWILKELIDRELYLLPDTWDLKKHAAIPLNKFLNDFKLFRRLSI
ncbi:MAG: hypothetical protein V1720_17155 [bacterium]